MDSKPGTVLFTYEVNSYLSFPPTKAQKVPVGARHKGALSAPIAHGSGSGGAATVGAVLTQRFCERDATVSKFDALSF